MDKSTVNKNEIKVVVEIYRPGRVSSSFEKILDLPEYNDKTWQRIESAIKDTATALAQKHIEKEYY